MFISMKTILNIGILISSIGFVYLIHQTTEDLFTKPYYSNDYVEFDKWSIVHVLSTTSLALYYPYPLSISSYLSFVLGWEFIENYFLPFWNPFLVPLLVPFWPIIGSRISSTFERVLDSILTWPRKSPGRPQKPSQEAPEDPSCDDGKSKRLKRGILEDKGPPRSRS